MRPIVSTVEAYQAEYEKLPEKLDLIDDGFYLSTKGKNIHTLSFSERGALYGAFECLSMLDRETTRRLPIHQIQMPLSAGPTSGIIFENMGLTAVLSVDMAVSQFSLTALVM